jgi:PAS domain S-box-containing protein
MNDVKSPSTALSALTKSQLIWLVEELRQQNRELEIAAEKVIERAASAGVDRRRLIDATESFTDGFALYDADDRLVVCNETYLAAMTDVADMLRPGILFEDMQRARMARKQCPDNEVRDEAWLQQRMQNHRAPGAPQLRHMNSGQIIEIQEHKTRDGGTAVIRRDITAETEAANALSESERRFQLLLDHASLGILVHRDYQALYANKALSDMYGYSEPSEILELESTRELTHPDFRFYSQPDRLRGDRAPADREVRGMRKNGETFWENRRSFIIDWEGEPAVCSTRTDIDARKEAEEVRRAAFERLERTVEERTRELRQSRDRFAALIEHCPASFSLKDRNGRFLFANRKWYDWHPDNRKDVIGKLTEQVAHPEDANRIRQFDRQVIDTHGVVEVEVPLTQSDGTEFLTLVQKFPVFDETGDVISIGTIRTDVTERRQAEMRVAQALEEAKRANEAKSAFMATMSHELRTPLNAILGFSEMMMKEFFGALGSPKYCEYAADINRSSQHLLQLINDLLDLSAIESGHHELSKEQIDLAEIVAECSTNLEQAASRKHLHYSITLPGDLPPILADRRALKQILLNVLANAVKFTPSGGYINLSATCTKRTFSIDIKNTGAKLSGANVSDLTKPFVRGETDPYRGIEGSGLGLAIVKSLIENHDGELKIGTNPNKEFIVTMVFPPD